MARGKHAQHKAAELSTEVEELRSELRQTKVWQGRYEAEHSKLDVANKTIERLRGERDAVAAPEIERLTALVRSAYEERDRIKEHEARQEKALEALIGFVKTRLTGTDVERMEQILSIISPEDAGGGIGVGVGGKPIPLDMALAVSQAKGERSKVSKVLHEDGQYRTKAPQPEPVLSEVLVAPEDVTDPREEAQP